MAELELEGLHPDGEHLVLIGQDGHRYRLAIDDALRAAVRRDRAQLEQVRSAEHLRPREIQSLVRAGTSVEDVARDAGLPVEHVRRYEGPVAAERAYVAEQARRLPIGHDPDAPSLGDLVVDRLAARGVDPNELTWTAIRRQGEGWELVLTFLAGDRERRARWGVDLQSRSVQAVDDEGRWLSEVELGAASSRRHLAAVRARVVDAAGGTADAEVPDDLDLPDDAAADEEPAADRTADLLEELRTSRGVRHQVDPSETDDEPERQEPPPAHPPASASHERPDATVLPLPFGDDGEGDGEGRRAGLPTSDNGRKPRPRSRRTSVPSWDEIVFGAKPE